MDARTYGIAAERDCLEWVNWMLDVTTAYVRVTTGLVVWVVSGVQRDKCYWPGVEGLMWEWWRRGNQLWRPCIWHKVDANGGGTGIPGSGGKQWLRADWEYCLAFKREGWLPWANNTALGWEPKYDKTGGAMSNRTVDGQRINAKVGGRLDRGKLPGSTRRKNGDYKRVARDGAKDMYTRNADGTRDITRGEVYTIPELVNPGNYIVRARVGGGHIGSDLAHESEAPYPEGIPEFFIRGWAPPDSVVCDPFSGSGTTAKVAVKFDRRFIGCDLRESQCLLTRRRMQEIEPWKKDESLPCDPMPLFDMETPA